MPPPPPPIQAVPVAKLCGCSATDRLPYICLPANFLAADCRGVLPRITSLSPIAIALAPAAAATAAACHTTSPGLGSGSCGGTSGPGGDAAVSHASSATAVAAAAAQPPPPQLVTVRGANLCGPHHHLLVRCEGESEAWEQGGVGCVPAPIHPVGAQPHRMPHPSTASAGYTHGGGHPAFDPGTHPALRPGPPAPRRGCPPQPNLSLAVLSTPVLLSPSTPPPRPPAPRALPPGGGDGAGGGTPAALRHRGGLDTGGGGLGGGGLGIQPALSSDPGGSNLPGSRPTLPLQGWLLSGMPSTLPGAAAGLLVGCPWQGDGSAAAEEHAWPGLNTRCPLLPPPACSLRCRRGGRGATLWRCRWVRGSCSTRRSATRKEQERGAASRGAASRQRVKADGSELLPSAPCLCMARCSAGQAAAVVSRQGWTPPLALPYTPCLLYTHRPPLALPPPHPLLHTAAGCAAGPQPPAAGAGRPPGGG